MSLRIGHNLAAQSVTRRVSEAGSEVSTSLTRLSSGMRINRASDDAASLSVASRLSARSRVYSQAVRNINDGISALNIADGTLSQFTNILGRMRELATQAASGSFSLTQRQALQAEGDALTREYNRLLSAASFNGLPLLDGNTRQLALQAGIGMEGMLNINLTGGLSRTVGSGFFAGSGGPVGTAYDIDTADFNGDGKMDIVAGAGSGSPVYVAFGTGSGSFSGSVTINTGVSSSTAVVAADFNGDGRMDIAAERAGIVSVALGNGNGTFQTPVSYNVGAGNSLFAEDMNGDGRPDLVSYSGSSVTVGLNLGNGTFPAGVSFSAGSAIADISLGDLDGDGDFDVAARMGSGKINVLYGNGAGSFGTYVSTGVGTGAGGLTTGDFNRDGIDDIAFLTGTAKLSVMLGQANGTFSAERTFGGSAVGGTELKAYDMNGDGYLDLVEGNGIHYGNGEGTFGNVVSVSNRNSDIAVADFTGDGALDFMVIFEGDESQLIIANSKQVTTLEYLNVASRSGALQALDKLEEALERVIAERQIVGSALSRAQVASQNLLSMKENYVSAYSRIMDADVAQESANMVRKQIVQQTAVALLAQANQQPALALRLIASS